MNDAVVVQDSAVQTNEQMTVSNPILPLQLIVKPILGKLAHPFILEKHYAHRVPSISYAFGLFMEDILIGICTYGTPPSPPLRVGVCGREWMSKILELNRLWTMDRSPHNASSFFVSKTFKWLPHPSIIISFADPTQGHIGYTYQALNFIYTGLSAKRTNWKIRGQEHLHGITIADKCRGQKHRAEFLRSLYGADFYLEPRPRKHRYVYFLGNKVERKVMEKALRYPIIKYPKKDDELL